MRGDIVVKANGAAVVSIDELIPMQGNLKDLSETNYAKLHDLILNNGFDSPIQVWLDTEGKKRILDGHQRLRVLKKLREEGYSIPSIPIDFIEADNYIDAKKRLLTKVSVYGDVQEEGLYEFTNEEGAIIEPDFGELLDIPGMDFTKNDVEIKGNGEPKEPEKITCPNCQHQFALEK